MQPQNYTPLIFLTLIIIMAILYQTVKLNSHQYFCLYGKITSCKLALLIACVINNIYFTEPTSMENTQSPSPRSSSSSSSLGGPQNPAPHKIIPPGSKVSNPMLQVSCQSSSPSTQTNECRYVYCDPWRMPKKSKIGTRDSGVGDVLNHTPLTVL